MIRRKNRLTSPKPTFIIFHIEEKTENLIEIETAQSLEEAKKIADDNPIAYIYSSNNSRVIYSTE